MRWQRVNLSKQFTARIGSAVCRKLENLLSVVWMTPAVAICETFDAKYTSSSAIWIIFTSVLSIHLIIVDREFFGNTWNDIEEVFERLPTKNGMLR